MPENPLAQTDAVTRLMARVAELERRVGDLQRTQYTGITTGLGSPEGVLTAPVGTLYRRQNGGTSTTLYVKESGSGNTGWVAK